MVKFRCLNRRWQRIGIYRANLPNSVLQSIWISGDRNLLLFFLQETRPILRCRVNGQTQASMAVFFQRNAPFPIKMLKRPGVYQVSAVNFRNNGRERKADSTK